MKRTISVIIAFLMIISLWRSINVFSVDDSLNVEMEEVELVSDNIYNKIHFYLDADEYTTIDSREELVTATNYAVKDYAETQYEKALVRGEKFNSYQVTVEFASDFMNTDTYKELMKEREKLGTIREVRNFRSRLNSFSKEYHTQLVNKSMKFVESMEYSAADSVAYAPFVILDTPIDNIMVDALVDVARNSNVMNISISTYEECQDEVILNDDFEVERSTTDPNTWENALKTINAYDIVDCEIYTGESIRIGILESSGVCDKTNLGLVDKDITVRESQSISNHATGVTLIASQIAPDAKYFVSKTVSGEWLEWFIDNGCDIVNYSAGTDTNEYSFSADAIIDYQVKAHCITFVKSAGNYDGGTTNNEITSPGYAFNAITVGGVTVNSSNKLIHHYMSCYASDYPDAKPNVAAKFKIVDIPYYVNTQGTAEMGGTSVAAPQVIGCIALLMESNNRLCAQPEVIHSLIASSAQKSYDYLENGDSGFDDKVGAGIINLGKMILNSKYLKVLNRNGEDSDHIISYDIHLNAGDEIQVAAAWLAHTDGIVNKGEIAVTQTYVTDYDLLLYRNTFGGGYADLLEAQSISSYSNVEMIRFTATVSGTYTIVIEQFDDIHQNNYGDYIVVTYNVD